MCNVIAYRNELSFWAITSAARLWAFFKWSTYAVTSLVLTTCSMGASELSANKRNFAKSTHMSLIWHCFLPQLTRYLHAEMSTPSDRLMCT